MDNIIEIIGEIDLITRDEYANGNIGYDAYVQITERLKKLHPLVKNNYFISPVVGQSEQYCECSTPKAFTSDKLYMCCEICDREVED
jgi:hypothetical protein